MPQSMKINPILVVAGEPNSIFLEIFFKSINNKQRFANVKERND